MDQVETVVIGAGVIGLGIARRLSQAGQQVLICEREAAIGTQTSARNSEVIHAGIYYPAQSLRARLCREGRDQLYAYLRERDLPHRQIGKLIVATSDDQIPMLHQIKLNAERAGEQSLQWLSAEAAHAMEPALSCVAALHSPLTGILDAPRFMLSLLGDAEAAGADLALQTEVVAIAPTEGGHLLTFADGYQLSATRVINAAGHGAVPLAKATDGLSPLLRPQAYFARGTYYGITGASPFSRLIYPVPEPGGLGIHLTLDMGGAMRFGPDVEWIDRVDTQLSDHRRAAFATAIRAYWPDLRAEDLAPLSCGVRPKIHGPETPAADFRIDGPASHGIQGLVNLFGIESPGLTSSLAIADHVAALLEASA